MHAYCCSTDPAIFCDACARITVWSTWFIYGLSFQWDSQVLYIYSHQVTGEAHFYHISLEGLGHAILGNFSTDQIVIELSQISK